MRKEKIMHVIAPGGLAGAERVVLGGIDALRADGEHEVELVVLEERRAPESYALFASAARAYGIHPHVIPTRAQVELSAIRHLHHKLCQASIVHAHGHKALAWSWAAKPKSTRIVTTHHGDLSGNLKAKFYEELSLKIYRRCDLVFAVDEANQARLMQLLGERDVALVENFLAMSAPAPRVRRVKGPLSLLALGRLSKEKGLDTLIEAIARCGKSVTLDIAGDGPMRGALERQVRELGLEHRVTFLGFVDAVRALLETHDALAMPSHREGMPMALIEALSAGLPILATNVGGIPSIVRPGEDAILTKAGDATLMARALERFVIHYPTLAAGAFESAFKTRHRFSAKRWSKQTNAHYTNLIDSRGGF